MVEKIGDVLEVYDTYCNVKIKRDSACGENCASCGACKHSESHITALNEINAKKGDRVMITMSTKALYIICFVVYMVPIIFMVAGYFISSYLLKNEDYAIFGAFVGVLVGVFLGKLLDRTAGKKYMPKIKRVIYKKDSENF